jgi:hypothetical protein
MDDSVPLWRYMKLSTLLLLLDGKAFFPTVATLQRGDPLEGDLILEEPELWLMERLHALPRGEFDLLFDWLWKKLSKMDQEWARGDPHWNSKLLSDVYLSELAKRRAVWCWFHALHESAAMWSIYANAGIAVRTSQGALKQALPHDVDFQVATITYFSRTVQSADALNPGKPENFPVMVRPHLMKGKEYEHENEVRIVTTCLSDQPGRMIALAQIANLIKEVVISHLLPFDERNSVASLVSAHPVWHGHPPSVRFSSMLGRKADEQEANARVEASFHDLLKDGEPDLPPLLNSLGTDEPLTT